MDEGITGFCFECGKPCTEHDLVWLTYWCDDCVRASFEDYELKKEKNA